MTPSKILRSNKKPKPQGVKVRPLRIYQLRSIAEKARELFRIETARVDVISLYEITLHKMGLVYEFVEESEMGNDHGLALPNDSVIKIREDVYVGAHEGNGRDRFTMIHEVGHLVLHHNVAFSRSVGEHMWIEDSEWQANTFAAEFMMPVETLKRMCRSPMDVVHVFGASVDAAHKRWEKLQEQGLLKDERAVSSRPFR